jgi:HlyD family secretion protein
MLEAGVGTRSAYDAAKARVEGARASVEGGKARIEQIDSSIQDAQVAVARAKSNYESVMQRVKQSEAGLNSQRDMFQKTTKYAPADGVVSDIAAKEGQYALASFSSTGLMIVNDMSQVNVEVKVDETDIKDVKLDQPAKVKVDALGEKEIAGKVVQIAASAITRSGQSIAQTTGSQEAKDFIVKIQLELNDDLRAKLRPGMSATAVITTQTRENILAIPLASIIQREEEQNKDNKDKTAQAPPANASGDKTKPKERQGVFVVKANKVIFTPIETGITGETDIEVLGGLNENDEIVVGPFKQLRTLKANAEIKREANNGQKKPDAPAAK